MKQENRDIRAVIFQEGDLWVAQCLEYDIGAQAHDLETVQRRLGVAVEIERQTSMEVYGTEFDGIDRAPARFFEMWPTQILKARDIRRSASSAVMVHSENIFG
jgi:hypothetical protein